MNTRHFFAPYGPTTAEQCHPQFKVAYEGHECQWNGPSWPYATSMTLVGLANLLNNQTQSFVDSRDFITLFSIYARSLYKKDANGIPTPWIDENLNPLLAIGYPGQCCQHVTKNPKNAEKIIIILYSATSSSTG